MLCRTRAATPAPLGCYTAYGDIILLRYRLLQRRLQQLLTFDIALLACCCTQPSICA
jgi:hypothetical protein